MEMSGVAKRVRIYCSQTDHWQHQSLYKAILGRLRDEGAAGATVIVASAGFTGRGPVVSADMVDLSPALPVLIEWVDRAENVERILPLVAPMLQRGLITVEDVQVYKYAGPGLGLLRPDRTVSEVMTREPRSARPD